MANVLSVESKFIEQIRYDITNNSGSNDIQKCYLNNSNGLPVQSNINDVDDKVEVQVVSSMAGDTKIILETVDNLSEQYTYDRVYFCNGDDKILIVIDVTELTEIDINNTFTVNLYEKDEVVI